MGGQGDKEIKRESGGLMNKRAVERRGPVITKLIEGEPIHAKGREIVPLVRVTTYGRRRAFVGSDRLTGEGWGVVHMRPVAIVERSETGERRIPIQDKTAQILGGLLLAAFIVPMLLGMAVHLARRT
jgi:uncharacterized spore protein YtfJ